MALLRESDIRFAARRGTVAKTARTILKEEAVTRRNHFDVFLSHSTSDAELVLGAMRILERLGLSVYVDWIEDLHLDRTRVTPATAETLRARMKQSDALFYLHTQNSSKSRWMPWELGYFDGQNGNVAILPTQEASNYKGEEYLGLYPYVDASGATVWIQRDTGTYRQFKEWRIASDKLRPLTL